MIRPTAASVAAVALLASIASSSAAAEPYASAARPHSRIVTYDRGDVLVRRLQMAVTRAHHRLHARVRLTVQNQSEGTLRRELRIGRCVTGAIAHPVCPTSATIDVRLAPGQLRSFTETVTLRQPPARQDTVEAALVARGARQPYSFRSDAELLLKGSAWRGEGAGRPYGVSFAGSDGARRLLFDIPATSRGRAYIFVKWQGTAAPSQAATTISRCRGAGCVDQPLRAASRRSGPMDFVNRFDFDRDGASAIGLRADAPATGGIFAAALPWPS